MKKPMIALMLCLSLGLGLTATNPAGASIIYVEGNQTATSSSPINLFLSEQNRLQIRINSGSTNLGLILGTYSYQASGIYNNAGSAYDNVNVPLGHHDPLIIELPSPLPDINLGSYAVLDKIPLGTLIGSNYDPLTPIAIPYPFSTNAQVAGFAGNLKRNSSVLVTLGAFRNQWGYAGFQFQDTDGIHYGWVHAIANYSNNNITNITIDGYAYETIPGQSILAGATPIPASVLLLGSGLMGLGLLGWRRKKS